MVCLCEKKHQKALDVIDMRRFFTFLPKTSSLFAPLVSARCQRMALLVLVDCKNAFYLNLRKIRDMKPALRILFHATGFKSASNGDADKAHRTRPAGQYVVASNLLVKPGPS
jgi:hypothetical protein